MQKKCPKCKEAITYLEHVETTAVVYKYNLKTLEYGKNPIDSWPIEDDGSYYQCPLCGEQLSSEQVEKLENN